MRLFLKVKRKLFKKGVEGLREISVFEGKKTESIIKKPVNEIIHIGTKGSKSEVTEKKVPFETIYKEDASLKKGEEKFFKRVLKVSLKVTTTYETQKVKSLKVLKK